MAVQKRLLGQTGVCYTERRRPEAHCLAGASREPSACSGGRRGAEGSHFTLSGRSPFSFQVFIEKQKGEILGVVIVESGWGSILPTVIIANMMHGGPAEKSGKLNIGDQIMSINGTSLVGLPLSTCQSIIKVRGGC